MPNQTKPEGWIKLPAIAAIGWIPFYKTLKHIPPGVDKNGYTKDWPWGYFWLFDSGNHDPGDNLISWEEGFLQIIESRDYRGAFFIDGLEVHRTSNEFTGCSESGHRRMEYIGYTPLRFYVPVVEHKFNSPIMPDKRGLLGGSSKDEHFEIDMKPEYFRITHRIEFRLCKLMEVAGGLLTFNPRGAPYVWMKMVFEVHFDGKYTLTTMGTAIPNQTYYLDWKKVEKCSYDMFDSTSKEMNDFLRTGNLGYIGASPRGPERTTNAKMVESGWLW